MRSSSRKKSSAVRRLSIGAVLMLGVLCSFVGTRPASAQAVYGSIFGTVVDKSGSAVANATITVTDESKGTTATTVTNETGAYRVQHLIRDAYRVTSRVGGHGRPQ